VKKENVSSIGTILASFLAASCCLGPAVFVVFGTSIGVFGKLSIMEAMRPYLLGVGFLMIGFSFWKLYVRKPDCNCEADVRSMKIARSIWWLGFASLVFAATFQKAILLIYG
jgi:mercuric ion transport protein